MKQHTLSYKNNIKEQGRELHLQITYDNIVLDNEVINSVNPRYQGALLKSVMKELEIDSNVAIPKGTEINFKFGVSLDNSLVEYLDFGNYIVKDIEKQEDSNSYLIKCYDKMLYSMKDYESLGITYPCTIRAYINALCTKLNLNFKNKADTFVNFDKILPNELYLDTNGNDIGFTYRDVFDQLAEVTASTICLDTNDNVEIRYINETNDTIDEEYLKDVNVNFGEKFGPINSVVLSRNGEDNIYEKDNISIQSNGLYEVKITDNQITNFNNRDEYIDDIFNKLKGTEYYLNDFSSTGITYYDLLDKYSVKIENKTYNCIMFNDSIEINQGLVENINTEKPEESQTDYNKADKTDRRINQTYRIVDKQNQTITSVVSQVDGQNKKITKVEQTVNELNSKISDIADITKMQESNNAVLIFDSINQSEPINIKIHPIVENISYLYASDTLYPSDNLYLKDRILRFTNTTDNTTIDYLLPDDLLYYDSNNYDEFILDYDLQICKVIKRVEYNTDGTTYVLPAEKEINYTYPKIELTDGDYKIELLGYNTAYMQIRLMSQNIYTTQFATKAEMNSAIDQKADEIDLSVNKKLGKYSTTAEMNSAINVKAEGITNEVNKKVGKEEFGTQVKQNWQAVQIAWNTVSQLIQFITENDNAEIQIRENANNKLMTLNKNGQKFYKSNKEFGKMGVHKDEKGNGYIAFSVPIEGYNSSIQDGMAWGVTTPKGNFYPIFNMKNFSIGAPNSGNVYGQLELVSSDLIVAGGGFGGIRAGNVRITGDDVSKSLTFEDPETGEILMTIIPQNYEFGTDVEINILNAIKFFRNAYGSNSLRVGQNGCLLTDDGSMQGNSLTLTGVPSNDISILASGEVHCSRLVQTSLEENKKNFEKLQNGLEIIDNTDIYKYNFKSENDTDKKHIGFVIGTDFNYSKQLTAIDKEQNEIGVDNYAMTSVAYKAIQELHQIVQEQQKIIEEQNKRIEILENKIKGGN